MKKIKLQSKLFALVDDEDYDYLNQFKWYSIKDKKTSYVVRNKTNKEPNRVLSMARLLMNTPNELEVDHIDHNGLNNQKANLRNCTKNQNRMNRISWSSSGKLGVHLSGKYILAHIRLNGKSVHLGMFKSIEDAATAYDEAAKKYYGEFANLNYKL